MLEKIVNCYYYGLQLLGQRAAAFSATFGFLLSFCYQVTENTTADR